VSVAGFISSHRCIYHSCERTEKAESGNIARETHLRASTVKETPLSTSTKSSEAQVRAEASFRKEERAKDGAKAMMEYQANGRVVREKMARLKALRLAKEATEKELELAGKRKPNKA
jgi:hypothetical protein